MDFEKRLKNLLSKYNSSENYYIGKELDHIKNNFCKIIDFNLFSVTTLNGINNLPKLEEIKKLKTVSMLNYEKGIIQPLSKYKHTIKKIQISNDAKPDMVNLQKYCTDNSIELIIQ